MTRIQNLDERNEVGLEEARRTRPSFFFRLQSADTCEPLWLRHMHTKRRSRRVTVSEWFGGQKLCSEPRREHLQRVVRENIALTHKQLDATDHPGEPSTALTGLRLQCSPRAFVIALGGESDGPPNSNTELQHSLRTT